MSIIIIILCTVALVLCGVVERRKLNENVAKIPWRINVNGIRGKSTATRFATAILEEAGYQVVGKTTGTSARLIVWNKHREIEIKRRPIGANIAEQISVIKKAADMGANALVCECMAVRPEYQQVYQHEIIQANIVVITNVVEDHLDDMGPTTDQIAQAFASTIPYNGKLVITKGPYARYFRREAANRNTEVICIDPDTIDNDFLAKFPYIVFPNNCAVGLGIAQALGLDEELAKRAMLKAHPDPGCTQVLRIARGDKQGWLVNAFAANEPVSSLEIWESVEHFRERTAHSVLILCCRDDRVDRSNQFIMDFLPYVQAETMLAIGTGTKEVLSAYRHNKFKKIGECVDLTGRSAEEIIQELEGVMDNSLIFCAGNIHGVAEDFLYDFAAIKI